jgi:PE family
MPPTSFHTVVADIGAQLVDIAISCLDAGTTASLAATGLVPAGDEKVSAQTLAAVKAEASMPALNNAAQEEPGRSGTALTRIAPTYSEVDKAAADALVFAFDPLGRD